jgi:hypothetical protein
MGKLKEIYKENIYGVMAALTFHLIVLSILLFVDINSHYVPEMDEIIIDFSAEEIKLPEPEKKPEEKSLDQLDPANNRPRELASNRAVNEAAKEASKSRDPFFDKEYRDEVAAAQKLASDVNRNLAQKIPEIGDIDMPEENTEGMTPEEIKKSSFKGKSNIKYYLENRYHVRLPIPVYLAEGGGEVVVDILVNRDGRVLSATPRPNPKISDMTIFAYAKQAAEKTRFNADPSAPEKQRGTITYVFVPQ